MGLKIGFCGAGGFVSSFIPLFQAHPLVEEVAVADLVRERVDERAKQFSIARTYDSMDELCRSDVDAICIFTQRWTHAPLALQALRAGKHVYCAVPTGVTVEEIGELVETVKRTGLIYMLGETSYYYPSTLYCRARHSRGDFGSIVYSEACYYHDMSHGFYEVYQRTGGKDWKRTASVPPMWYPTHSVSMITSVTGAYMTDVSCLGYVDHHDDGIFRTDVSQWKNRYSNETGLMRMSDGSICRINEFRRVGWTGGTSVHCSIYGTEASFEEQAQAQTWVTRDWNGRKLDLQPVLKCRPPTRKPSAGDRLAALSAMELVDFYGDVSTVHPVIRLPAEFRGKHTGHEGSHQFLVDDFVQAVHTHRHPPNHIWAAARYALPGIVAHESALRDGERMKIPDFGGAPESTPTVPHTLGCLDIPGAI